MSETIKKIKDMDEMARLVSALKAENKTVVMCHGVFDLVHPGHIRHLSAARKEGDVLLVSVTPDQYVNRGPDRPIFPQELRAEVLASLKDVDYVVINKWSTAVETIKTLKPSVYIKGEDYEDRSKDTTGKIYNEEEAIQSVGGRLAFTHEIAFSSSSLVNNFLNVYSKETSNFLKDFRKRINGQELIERLHQLENCKTLVLGDTIIDQYHYCTPVGKSPKANVIVTRFLSDESFAGGVLAAANHVASFCNSVDLITGLGDQNSHEEFIRSNLKKNVQPFLFKLEKSPTTIKRRFVEPDYMHKMFEICFMNGDHLDSKIENKICSQLDKTISNYDLVLVTDFGHGFMTPKMIDLVCKKAKFLAVNAQTNSSNMGFNLITKYPHADYVCIDELEARMALHDKHEDIDAIIKRLFSKLEAESVILTHGNNGCYAFSKRDQLLKVPALTNSVVDTIGAGDAFLSVSSPCAAMGFPLEQIGFIGNAAGAIKVGIVGNRSSVEKVPLVKFIERLLK